MKSNTANSVSSRQHSGTKHAAAACGMKRKFVQDLDLYEMMYWSPVDSCCLVHMCAVPVDHKTFKHVIVDIYITLYSFYSDKESQLSTSVASSYIMFVAVGLLFVTSLSQITLFVVPLCLPCLYPHRTLLRHPRLAVVVAPAEHLHDAAYWDHTDVAAPDVEATCTSYEAAAVLVPVYVAVGEDASCGVDCKDRENHSRVVVACADDGVVDNVAATWASRPRPYEEDTDAAACGAEGRLLRRGIVLAKAPVR